jgi:hypothetical protein
MAGERLRIPVDTEYVSALGLAAYAFARCEWQVVWCCEKVRAGAVSKITRDEMTAGSIAKYFANLARNMPASDTRTTLSDLAKEFIRLVDVRNRIVHGKPCTAPDGSQRLSSAGIIDQDEVEDAADAFAACSSALNDVYYGKLDGSLPTE